MSKPLGFGDTRLPERFWAKVSPEPNSGCWLWAGSGNQIGYGRMRFEGRTQVVHRIAYKALVGPLPEHPEVDLDHLCRVRCCCNPDHVEPVTHAENIRRGQTGIVNRSKTHCRSGHEYTEANTYVYQATGERQCRTCQRERSRRCAST